MHRRHRSNWTPLVQLLAQEVRLLGKQYIRALDFAQVEDQRGHFLGSRAGSIRKALEEVAERGCLIDDTVQDLFLVGLERQTRDLGLPLEEIL